MDSAFYTPTYYTRIRAIVTVCPESLAPTLIYTLLRITVLCPTPRIGRSILTYDETSSDHCLAQSEIYYETDRGTSMYTSILPSASVCAHFWSSRCRWPEESYSFQSRLDVRAILIILVSSFKFIGISSESDKRSCVIIEAGLFLSFTCFPGTFLLNTLTPVIVDFTRHQNSSS